MSKNESKGTNIPQYRTNDTYVDLAEKYFFGEDGVEIDYDKAFEYLIKAEEEEDDDDVFYLLGVCYEEGLGVEQNTDMAVDYYRKAFSNDDAQYRLALIYIEQYPDDDVYLEGKDLLIDLAEREHIDAVIGLAKGYVEGKWIEQDLDKAHSLHLVILKQGSLLGILSAVITLKNSNMYEQAYYLLKYLNIVHHNPSLSKLDLPKNCYKLLVEKYYNLALSKISPEKIESINAEVMAKFFNKEPDNLTGK